MSRQTLKAHLWLTQKLDMCYRELQVKRSLYEVSESFWWPVSYSCIEKKLKQSTEI